MQQEFRFCNALSWPCRKFLRAALSRRIFRPSPGRESARQLTGKMDILMLAIRLVLQTFDCLGRHLPCPITPVDLTS
jgi:hypothetical protein